jgi:hypothetical protein
MMLGALPDGAYPGLHRIRWMPPSDKWLRHIAPAATMVSMAVKKKTLPKHTF